MPALRVILSILLLAGSARAQFLASYQANSAEEFDAYLDAVQADGPAAVLVAAARFEQRWPNSELLAQVYDLQFRAFRSLGDAAGAARAGEKALERAPGNLPVMAGMALIFANGTRDPARLARAESYARRLLEEVEKFAVPRSIGPKQWERIRAGLESQGHAALGLVAFQRGEIRKATSELETAVGLAVEPDGSQLYRLGLLYGLQGRREEAANMLRKAARLEEPGIRRLAEAELEKLRDP